ncbi:MAG: HEAT repeat domain-containing protein [Thermoanaerobaculia bacterium]
MRWRVLLFTLCLFGFGSPAAADEKSVAREQTAQVLLNPAGPEVLLIQTLEQFENEFPDSPTAAAKILPLVRDERPKVRRTAVRVLSVLQADLDEKGLADVARMLSSDDKAEVVDALKALRWLYAPSTIPSILPLLSDSDEHVKREACRALAVIADRSVISKIEPLLKDPIKDVREDAEGSITQLRRKP